MPIGGRIKKNVDININLNDKNFGQRINKLGQQVQTSFSNLDGISSKLDRSNKEYAQSMKDFNTSNQGFASTMRMSQEELAGFNKRGGKFNRMGGLMANKIRMATHGMRGFRMEMLGVMFFGMALQRTFNGLIKTSMEWFGVMEIFQTALGVLFMPVAELFLEWALQFLEWVLELNPATKKLISFVVLLGLALGSALFVFGTFALGIGSLILAFGWLLSPLGLVIAGFTALAGFFLLKKLFDDTGEGVDNLREKVVAFGISGEAFDRVANKIKEWYNIAKDKLFGDKEEGELGFFGKIKEKISNFVSKNEETLIGTGKEIMNKLIDGAKQFFKENPLVFVGAIAGSLVGGKAGAAIGGALGSLFGKLDIETISEIADSGLDILDNLVTAITDNLDKLEDVITDITEKLSDFVIEHFDEFVDIGVSIAGAIAQGIGNSIKKKLDNLLNIEPGSNKEKLFWGPNVSTEGGNGKTGLEMLQGNDFIVQPGGKMIKTNPNDYLIATKTPGDLGGGGVTMNVTYNVSVSDKREFEEMLERNNRQLTNETRSLT